MRSFAGGITGRSLFNCACLIWKGPDRELGISPASSNWSDLIKQSVKLPPDGTAVKFTYFGKIYTGNVVGSELHVEGVDGKFGSLSAASGAITKTSRNGWNDWYLADKQGTWTLANDWRQMTSAGN